MTSYVYHFTSTLDSTYHIETLEDMARVEQRMSELVQGEKGRCCILNSAAYTRLRLAALYERQRFMCLRIRHNSLTLELLGQQVSIYVEHGERAEEVAMHGSSSACKRPRCV